MIVALDSASPDQSVALADSSGSVLGQDAWTATRGQGHELLPRLLGLLDHEGLTLGAVSGVAVGIGPGSFTGLRVGVALAKGLAAGLSVPIVGIPSLEAWLAAEPTAAAALVRAGSTDVWAAARDHPEPRLLAFDALSPEARSAPLVASRELVAALDLSRPIPPDRAAPRPSPGARPRASGWRRSMTLRPWSRSTSPAPRPGRPGSASVTWL